jgi:diguanylate cyclase (GGDEF)-like protein
VGHVAGDSCLKAVAKILMGTARIAESRFRLRGQDTAARFGGDEFALILPSTPKTGAAVKAEQLRAFVERYDCSDVGIERQSVSIGIAGLPAHRRDRDPGHPGLRGAVPTDGRGVSRSDDVVQYG